MAVRFINFLKPYAGRIFFVWLVIVTILTFIPFPSEAMTRIDIGKIEIRLDYLFHIIIYASGIFLAFFWRANKQMKTSPGDMIMITLLLLALATGQEFLQKLIPYRAFNINDIISNTAGILTGLPLTLLVFKSIRKANYN